MDIVLVIVIAVIVVIVLKVFFFMFLKKKMRESEQFGVDAESASVEFGDGESGRRPPASGDVHADNYRHGGGEEGNSESEDKEKR